MNYIESNCSTFNVRGRGFLQNVTSKDKHIFLSRPLLSPYWFIMISSPFSIRMGMLGVLQCTPYIQKHSRLTHPTLQTAATLLRLAARASFQMTFEELQRPVHRTVIACHDTSAKRCMMTSSFPTFFISLIFHLIILHNRSI